ncbi:MAG: type IV pilus biogenesis/stability protein PilW [Pseudomonadota bacterium]
MKAHTHPPSRAMAAASLLAIVVLLNACISTTTGRARSQPDEAGAAEQFYQLGARYYRAGNFEFARDRLERALELDPRMAIAHSTLALTYEQLDVPRLAADHYNLAVRYAPRNIAVRNAYAVFLCREKEYDDAREQFDRIIREPDNDDPEIMLTNAGVCMLQKPDAALAEDYFRKALEEKRDYPEALLQMILLKRTTGDTLSARGFLQRYMSVQPTTPALLVLAMDIEKDMGDERARREYMNQLLNQFPDSDEARRLSEIG